MKCTKTYASGLADFGVGNITGLNQEVVADEIVREACFAVLPSKHRLSNRKSITLKDLEDEEFVSLSTAAGLRRQIDGIAASNGIALKHMTVVEQFGTLFDFVAADVGVAIVPASALPGRRQYDVVVKRLVSPSIVRASGSCASKIVLLLRRQAALDIFRPLFLSASRR